MYYTTTESENLTNATFWSSSNSPRWKFHHLIHRKKWTLPQYKGHKLNIDASCIIEVESDSVQVFRAINEGMHSNFDARDFGEKKNFDRIIFRYFNRKITKLQTKC